MLEVLIDLVGQPPLLPGMRVDVFLRPEATAGPASGLQQQSAAGAPRARLGPTQSQRPEIASVEFVLAVDGSVQVAELACDAKFKGLASVLGQARAAALVGGFAIGFGHNDIANQSDISRALFALALEPCSRVSNVAVAFSSLSLRTRLRRPLLLLLAAFALAASPASPNSPRALGLAGLLLQDIGGTGADPQRGDPATISAHKGKPGFATRLVE